jgi:hypothetical protein
VDAVSEALGEAVGQVYVAKYFPPADKARIESMVQNLMVAFGQRIDRLDWMAPATRAKAKAKLSTLKVHVGYPAKFRDYGALEVVKDDAYGNAARAELFEYRRNVAKLGKPVDRGEWVMYPQTVNAVNLPVMNAMKLPAAILQPPFFDPIRPDGDGTTARSGDHRPRGLAQLRRPGRAVSTRRASLPTGGAGFRHAATFQESASRHRRAVTTRTEALPGLHVKRQADDLGERGRTLSAGLAAAYGTRTPAVARCAACRRTAVFGGLLGRPAVSSSGFRGPELDAPRCASRCFGRSFSPTATRPTEFRADTGGRKPSTRGTRLSM